VLRILVFLVGLLECEINKVITKHDASWSRDGLLQSENNKSKRRIIRSINQSYNLTNLLNLSSTFRLFHVLVYTIRSIITYDRIDLYEIGKRVGNLFLGQKYAFMSGDYKKNSGANLDSKGSTGAIHKSSLRRAFLVE